MLHLSTASFATPLALGMPQGFEWLLIMGIGLLLFGKRLPEVGKSLGQGIVQFKKGLKGVEDEVSSVDNDIDRQKDQQTRSQPTLAEKPTVQAFDPYTGKPIAATDQHAAHG